MKNKISFKFKIKKIVRDFRFSQNKVAVASRKFAVASQKLEWQVKNWSGKSKICGGKSKG